MITAQRIVAQHGLRQLAGLDFAFGPGLRAIVGREEDGTTLLLEVLAGLRARRGGQLFVLGEEPTAGAARRAIAYVSREPAWPAALRVVEALDLAATLRAEPVVAGSTSRSTPRELVASPRARLEAYGLGALGTRRGASLSREERRALALTEALTAPEVRVVLLDEPFCALPPTFVGLVPGALRTAAAEGRCIVVATASLRDATDLADDLLVLFRGGVALRVPAGDALALAAPPRLRVVVSDPAAFLAALPGEPTVTSIAHAEGVVVAAGTSAESLARAVGAAILASGVEVHELALEGPQFAATAPRPGAPTRLLPSQPPPALP